MQKIARKGEKVIRFLGNKPVFLRKGELTNQEVSSGRCVLVIGLAATCGWAQQREEPCNPSVISLILDKHLPHSYYLLRFATQRCTSAGEKFVTEPEKEEPAGTFVSLKIKKKKQGGPSPGFK